MSNGHKLEFINTGAELHVYYWDWINGSNDTVFYIRDGKAFKEIDGKEIECDLAKELEELAKRVDGQVKTFYANKKP